MELVFKFFPNIYSKENNLPGWGVDNNGLYLSFIGLCQVSGATPKGLCYVYQKVIFK